ncbi:hypothetical protein LguiB_029265 [Lonicera macranthoides]
MVTKNIIDIADLMIILYYKNPKGGPRQFNDGDLIPYEATSHRFESLGNNSLEPAL